jgi:ribosomal 50S subunit-recycling heat shock protein
VSASPMSTQDRFNLCDRIVKLRALAADLAAQGYAEVAAAHLAEVDDLLVVLRADREAEIEVTAAAIRADRERAAAAREVREAALAKVRGYRKLDWGQVDGTFGHVGR